MKIGDKVSVIDDDLGGIITSINGKNVSFRDDHGFVHQFPSEKVVIQNHSIYEDLKVEYKQEHRKSQSKKHNKNPLVLDLHFERLVPDPDKHDSFSRLFIQREKLISTIAFCRKHHIKKLEIIHGIGDGVLQNMVYDVLESQTGLEFHNREILHHQSGTVIVHFV